MAVVGGSFPMNKITFGDMADALANLRKKNGLFNNYSNREIFDEAIKIKKRNQTIGLIILTIIVSAITLYVWTQ